MTLTNHDEQFKNDLEKSLFKCSFEEVRNHPELVHLNLTDQEIIQNRFLLAKFLNRSKLCNSQLELCSNINTHYRFYRQEDHVEKILNYETYRCTKLKAWDQLHYEDQLKLYNKLVFSHNIIRPDLNVLTKISEQIKSKVAEATTNINPKLFQIIDEIKWFYKSYINGNKNIFCSIVPKSLRSSEIFFFFILLQVLKRTNTKIHVTNIVGLNELIKNRKFNNLSNKKETDSVYRAFKNAKFLLLIDFDNSSLEMKDHSQNIYPFLAERILHPEFSTVIISGSYWEKYYEKLKIRDDARLSFTKKNITSINLEGEVFDFYQNEFSFNQEQQKKKSYKNL
ncbi:hypothetical protein J2Z62_000238 [Mycoplasmoides fastidiosum]|uniref:Uncharacterized protein n=1 Tax=Mycoplasmoides fastidiosum TaxID=92758 RepID=A0ABU0LYN7_9BACT|nr:hypothetical protein [Mycoplasmoides fastidiosum]MDQ0513800.1 hypothetical protein [Mycoplasmoides fastidiosum]UUD37782.1 hypothetical protein NPA10_00060 [Mycoplasmoides fastidiosum]